MSTLFDELMESVRQMDEILRDERRPWASLMNLGGFSSFAWGGVAGSVSVMTVISTLSGGIAAILGYVFFKERLAKVQVLGVVLVLAGAFVLHLKT